MLGERFDLGPNDAGREASLTVYVQTYSKEIAVEKRPLVLICPGGGYEYTSDREAEPVALVFAAAGFNAAVLRYSCAPARDPEARCELAGAISFIREHAEEWHTDEDRIILWGASAGGHLAAHYACTWKSEMPELTGLPAEKISVAGLMLAYPVITSGPKAHQGSIMNLLGEKYDDTGERDRVSLEARVNGDVPPTFIWHTWTDGSVPVENSLMFATALKKEDISTELHIFPTGGHGLSLADERTLSPGRHENEPCCQIWTELAVRWIKSL